MQILDLENNNEYTLYELDNNESLHNDIMNMIPEIRKYYIESKDFHFTQDGKYIRTHKYTFANL